MSDPTTTTFLHDDGTSQAGRAQPALEPNYVSVDERTLADFVRFARDYSRHLRYFDLQDRDAGDWSGFLGPVEGDGSVDLEKLAAVAEKLMAGAELEDEKPLRTLIARPHVALYIAFAKLLGLAQIQLNDLTRSHLEFFYETVLRMAPKLPESDRVNVWFELAPHITRTIRIDQDTPLIAKDHTGQLCTYRTTEPLFVNRARIHELRSIYVDKEITTLEDVSRLRHGTDPQSAKNALLKMLEIALGTPNPGDPLPAYSRTDETIDFQFLETDLLDKVYDEQTSLNQRVPWYMDVADMRSLMDNRSEERWSAVNRILEAAGKRKHGPDFVLDPPDPADFSDNLWTALGEGDADAENGKNRFKERLEEDYGEILRIETFFHMPAEDFVHMMLVAIQGSGASDHDWRRVGSILTESYRQRVYSNRRKRLRDIREQYEPDRPDKGFLPMVQAALGKDPADTPPVTGDSGEESPPALERLGDFIEPGDTVEGVTDPKEFLEEQYREALKADGTLGWDTVYHIVELAERRRENLPPLFPRKVLWRNLYPFSNARSVKPSLGSEDEEDLPRWKTFGRIPANLSAAHPPAEALGWAISSPLLSLSEGTRTIVLTLGFRPETFTTDGQRRLIDKEAGKLVEDVVSAFRVQLSTGAEWISSDTLENGTFGMKYDEIARDDADPIPAFRFTFVLPPELPGLAPPVSGGNGVAAEWPVLRIMLRQRWEESRYTTCYALLHDLVLESARLQVTVAGLTALKVQSDEKILDATKPFEPFGSRPAVGSRFYVGHPELLVKELDELTFDVDWMGLPEAGLKAHYETYAFDGSATPDHTSFKIDIALVENRRARSLEPGKALFTNGDNQKETDSVSIKITDNLHGHGRILKPPASNRVLSWPRCLQWELNPKDFLHAAYPAIAARKATGLTAAIANNGTGDGIDPKKYYVNPPYTPTVKTLRLGYVSSVDLPLDRSVLSAGDQLLHIHPFGYTPVQAEDEPWLLPRYDDQGELYIAIADASPGEIASILFQMAEGSANPDLEPQAIEWHYLDANRWRSLHDGKLRSDETRGLINSGIVRIALPEARPSTRLPGDVVWLRAKIGQHPNSVCDTVNLHAQAVSAEYVDTNGSPEHYSRPLAPDSIAGLATPLAPIAAVHQAYTSTGGKPREHASVFYTRAAERLRHKQRGLTAWDYERLILEHFPQIHKAKCLTADFERPHEPGKPDPRTPGMIDVVVIPDIRNQRPSDPFAPKAPSNLLAEIKGYLAGKIPPYARLQVRNAHYVPVKTRFAVRFMPDIDQGYARATMVHELNKFLSPWAYENRAEITIGGRIYANSLVNFLDQLDYVDYVAALKLFKLEKYASDFRIVLPTAGSTGYHVASDYPDSVLVAAPDHVVDVITDIDYEEHSFTGINHMRVELDFLVAPNPEG